MSEPLPVNVDLDKLRARMDNGLDLLCAMIAAQGQRNTELESQLGQAHELLTTLEEARKRDNAHLLAEIDRLEARLHITLEQLGYLGRLVEILRDAAAPAATALFNIAEQPGLDAHTREAIQQTLAPLDAALAVARKEKQ